MTLESLVTLVLLGGANSITHASLQHTSWCLDVIEHCLECFISTTCTDGTTSVFVFLTTLLSLVMMFFELYFTQKNI